MLGTAASGGTSTGDRMEYIEVSCPHCKKIVEFKPDESVLDCPFCDGRVERKVRSRKRYRGGSGARDVDERLSDAYEEGVKKGREAERKRETAQARTYLWAAMVLGAVGGGLIGGNMEGSPDGKIMRVVVGIALGGLLGGMNHIFGCLLTLVIFVVGAIAVVACVAM